jgi:hypothetical protein
VAVYDLAVSRVTGDLIAATHGRGMFAAVGDTAVASLAIARSVDTLVVGESKPLGVSALNALGDVVVATLGYTSSNPAVAAIDATGVVTGRATGSATITATTAGGLTASVSIVVVAPSSLAVVGQTVASAAPTSSGAGSELPLLRMRFRAEGVEGIAITSLAFDVSGRDAGARLRLMRDADHDGVVDPGERSVAQAPVSLIDGNTVRVTLAPQNLVVPGSDSLSLIAELLLSGGTPNGATFHIAYVPDATQSIGLRSGRRNFIAQPTTSVTASARTSVLGANEFFALSENPVRSDRVIFSFSAEPRVAAVYTLAGRRVADLRRRLDGADRAVWDLTNDDGSPVAAGVYLIVVDVGGRVVRDKLIVVRPAPQDDAEEQQ